MSTGGSIQEITIAGRTFPATADVDVTRQLGGFTNETQANGNGTTRQVKTRVPWMLSGISVSIDDLNGDAEFLQDIADGSDDVPVTITLASGVIYQGTGTINGDLATSSQSTTASFDMSGPGKLTPQ